MKTINKVNNKVKEVKVTAKVEEKKTIAKVVREIMLDDKGQRVHKMNINMKNKLLANVEFDTSKEFNENTKYTLSLKSNKHFSRFLQELKIAVSTSTNLAKNNNELINIRSNTKYFIVNCLDSMYLVCSNKGMIEKYVKIIE